MPCVRIVTMTATQKRAYVIADNKLVLNAGWDEELRGLGKSEMLWNPNIVVSVMYRCLHHLLTDGVAAP